MVSRLNEIIQTINTDSSGKWVRADDVNYAAQLIVKECLFRILGTHLSTGSDPIITSEYNLGYTKGVDMCYKMVQQHFSK